MKPGAGVSAAMARLAAIAASLASLASRSAAGLAGAAGSLLGRLARRPPGSGAPSAPASRPRTAPSRPPVALVAVAIVALTFLALVLAFSIALSRRAGPGEASGVAARPSAGPGTPVPRQGGPRGLAEFPSDPREIAGMLVIPGLDDWPYPLALVPKPRYTEADADGLWPDFGSMDLSDVSRRRKAELEAILDAVD